MCASIENIFSLIETSMKLAFSWKNFYKASLNVSWILPDWDVQFLTFPRGESRITSVMDKAVLYWTFIVLEETIYDCLWLTCL